MLHPATPFPQQGSYGLYQDPALSPANRPSELVRIIERGSSVVLVSFPLRDGAGGNMRVPLSDILDGTELDGEESREMTDLQRSLAGRSMRTKAQKAAQTRLLALQSRNIWSGCLRRRLDELSRRTNARKAA